MTADEILDACEHIAEEAHDKNGVALPGVCRLCTGKALAAAVEEEREAIKKACEEAEMVLRRDAARSSPQSPYKIGAANGIQGVAELVRARGSR